MHNEEVLSHQLENNLTLNEVLAQTWQSLVDGAKQRNHPYHTGILTTSSANIPSARTVVLRKANPETQTLIFHTDKRSEKISTLKINPMISWLFYNSVDRIQLRLEGRAIIHEDDEQKEHQWNKTQLMSRRCYLTLPPSSKLSHASSGLSEQLLKRNPTFEESELGKENFVVVETIIHSLDWLWLNSSGHLRAKFVWGNALESSWIVP